MPAAAEVASLHVLEQVNTLFAQALKRPVSEVQVAEDRADQLVASRLQILANFQSKHLPPDISDAFENAIKLTLGCHDFASGFVKLARLVEPLGKLGEKDLFGIALLEQQNTQEPAEQLGVKLETYDAIVEEVSNPTDRSFSEVITEKFDGRSNKDKIIAGSTATLLVARQDCQSALNIDPAPACNRDPLCWLVPVVHRGGPARRGVPT